jgi:hypothetical protein
LLAFCSSATERRLVRPEAGKGVFIRFSPPVSAQEVVAMLLAACSRIDSQWPQEEPGSRPDQEEIDDDSPLELDDDYWDALIPDDDYEPLPEYGDFWTDDKL